MSLRLIQGICLTFILFVLFGLQIPYVIKTLIVVPITLLMWFITVKSGDYKLKSYKPGKITIIIVLMIIGYLFAQTR